MGTLHPGPIGNNGSAGWLERIYRGYEWHDLRVEHPTRRMMATMLAGIAQFERDLLSERVKFGQAAAKARGKKLGRQKVNGQSQTGWHPRCWS